MGGAAAAAAAATAAPSFSNLTHFLLLPSTSYLFPSSCYALNHSSRLKPSPSFSSNLRNIAFERLDRFLFLLLSPPLSFSFFLIPLSFDYAFTLVPLFFLVLSSPFLRVRFENTRLATSLGTGKKSSSGPRRREEEKQDPGWRMRRRTRTVRIVT